MGSRQWIGAIEIGFVIETLLGVTAKVITVSKGANIDLKARDLAEHFDRQAIFKSCPLKSCHAPGPTSSCIARTILMLEPLEKTGIS